MSSGASPAPLTPGRQAAKAEICRLIKALGQDGPATAPLKPPQPSVLAPIGQPLPKAVWPAESLPLPAENTRRRGRIGMRYVAVIPETDRQFPATCSRPARQLCAQGRHSSQLLRRWNADVGARSDIGAVGSLHLKVADQARIIGIDRPAPAARDVAPLNREMEMPVENRPLASRAGARGPIAPSRPRVRDRGSWCGPPRQSLLSAHELAALARRARPRERPPPADRAGYARKP